MRTTFLLWWLSALSLLGQGFGSYGDLPFFSGGLPNTNAPGLNLTNLPGEILFVDAHFLVTNTSSAQAGNGDPIKLWGDLTTNHFDLSQLGGTLTPTNFSTGGPTNGPYLDFYNDSITNYLGATNIAQPYVFFFVTKCITPTTSGALLNGLPGQILQWNMASDSGYHLYAGVDQGFVTSANAVALGWPLGTWAIVTYAINGTSSMIRINGSGFPIGGATNFNFGVNPMKGITLGSYVGGSLGGRLIMSSLIIVSGSTWTTNANLLAVEELLGKGNGISVP